MPITLTEEPVLQSFEVFVANSNGDKFDVHLFYRAWHGHDPVDARVVLQQLPEPLPVTFWTTAVPLAIAGAYSDLGYELPK